MSWPSTQSNVDSVQLFGSKAQDINDGTGLSALAPDHVAYLTPVMRTARYDVT